MFRGSKSRNKVSVGEPAVIYSKYIVVSTFIYYFVDSLVNTVLLQYNFMNYNLLLPCVPLLQYSLKSAIFTTLVQFYTFQCSAFIYFSNA